MHIKQPTVIPPNVKITRLPPSDGKVRSLYSLEKAQERELERQAQKKEQAQKFTDLLKAGHSVSEALSLLDK